MESKLDFIDRIEEMRFVHAIRRGLLLTMPLLMVGSFALILNVLPIPAYQAFLQSGGGWLYRFFDAINGVTFGALSLCITISVSTAYTRVTLNQTSLAMGAVFSSISVYFIFIGLFTDEFNVASLGAMGMFTAIFSAVTASAIYCHFVERRWFHVRMYTVGANFDFNNLMSIILPVAVVVVLGFTLNWLLVLIFGVGNFEQLFHNATYAFFDLFDSLSVKTLLYIFMSNFLWFFGVHGANVLDGAAQNMFFIENGSVVPGFLNKSVIDVFVFMGGSGATISLLVAVLLFSKRKSNKRLAKMAAIPMLFNVNEMLLFGLPVIFNTSYLIPFLLVPFVSVATSAVAIGAGLVPQPMHVDWMMPIFFSGYISTGSIAGVLLQLFNITIGVFIYRFFLISGEKRADARVKYHMDCLIKLVQEAELSGDMPELLELRNTEGALAKMLAADLAYELKHQGTFKLFYQPQYNEKDQCIGCEALVRWAHPQCGMVYPPLLVGLALETGVLTKMERDIFEMACQDIVMMKDSGLSPPSISVNITAITLQEDGFVEFLAELIARYPQVCGILSIELTEQMSFAMSDKMDVRLEAILEMGVRLEIDDFSMGHTSLKYLQTNVFERIKLDGSLMRNMMTNERSVEIIASIVHMSKTMNFELIAEYVETVEQRDKLAEMGCFMYQGYLYSPAITLPKLIERVKSEGGFASL